MPTSVLQEASKALEQLDVDKILPAYAGRFLFEDVPLGLQIHDLGELRSYFQELFSWPGVAFSDIQIFENETFAVIEWTWRGLKPNTEERFHIRGVSVIELSGGKIARESIYYDPRLASGEM